MKKKISLLLGEFHENVSFLNPLVQKLGHSSQIQNDDLMHREGLKG